MGDEVNGDGSMKSTFSFKNKFCFYSSIHGTLHSVDQYLNIKLMDVNVTDPEKFPHMVNIEFLIIISSS